MTLRKSIAFALLIFSALFLPAQNLAEFSIKKVTLDDGLSQGSNYFRYEDSLGYLWISANDAVNRFDGKEVKVYNLNRYFDNCPNLAQAYGIAEDDATNIYFGSRLGLYCYTREKGVFSLISVFKDKDNQLTMPFGFWDYKIWCFNNRFEISSYDVRTKKIQFFTQLSLPEIPSVHVYNQTPSKSFYQSFPKIIKGQAWFCTEKKVLQLDLKTKQVSEPISKANIGSDMSFNSFYFNEENENLLFTSSKGLIQYSCKDKKISVQKELDNLSLKSCLSAVANEKTLMVLKPSGLTLFNLKTGKKFYESLKKTTYYTFGFDKNGRLWFCDDGKGQVIFDFNPSLIQKVSSEKMSIGVASINPINENGFLLNSNFIWQKNINKIEKTTGILATLTNFRTSYDPIHKGIWLFADASVAKKVFYFLDEHKNLTAFGNAEVLQKLGKIQDMKSVSPDVILIACEGGLFLFNKAQNTFEAVKNQKQKNAFFINPLSENHFAISYINGDMLLFKIEGQAKLIFQRSLLPGKQSFYLQEDRKKQQFWVATNNGLFLLDKNFNILKTFDADCGMAGTYIYGLLLDEAGAVWASHQRGLSSVNSSTHQVINYDLNDGVQDWDFNNRAFCKTKDGTLYFGGGSGFNYFKPPLQRFSNYRPKLYIDEIKVNSKFYQPQQNPDFLTKIELLRSENNISIKTGIVDLQNAASYKVAYRLNKGKWNYLSKGSEINYSSLSPATYVLELGIYDKFSNKIKLQKKLQFHIEAHFYEKIWFWAFLSILITGLLFYTSNQRKLARQKGKFLQRLEIERERNKITTDLHDDLGASLSSLQINSAVAQKLFDKNPAEAKKILKKIEAQAKSISENIGDIIWSLKPSKGEFMSLNTRIKKITSEILGSTDIHYKIKIDPTFETEISDFSARKNIILICKESLNNILKHSKATKVNLNIYKTDTSFIIEISDNGLGFTAGKTDGNGLVNIKKRTKELDGEVEIGQQDGTIIKINIPRIREF